MSKKRRDIPVFDQPIIETHCHLDYLKDRPLAETLAEAQRVLEPGGRIIMIEPAITLLSSPFFRLLHPEPVDMTADPFAEITPDPDRKRQVGRRLAL